MKTPKKVAHTPGPWVVDRRSDGDINAIDIIAPNDGSRVASIIADDKVGPRDRADAALIAAAPDLLTALCILRAVLDLKRAPTASQRREAAAIADHVIAKVAA